MGAAGFKIFEANAEFTLDTGAFAQGMSNALAISQRGSQQLEALTRAGKGMGNELGQSGHRAGSGLMMMEQSLRAALKGSEGLDHGTRHLVHGLGEMGFAVVAGAASFGLLPGMALAAAAGISSLLDMWHERADRAKEATLELAKSVHVLAQAQEDARQSQISAMSAATPRERAIEGRKASDAVRTQVKAIDDEMKLVQKQLDEYSKAHPRGDTATDMTGARLKQQLKELKAQRAELQSESGDIVTPGSTIDTLNKQSQSSIVEAYNQARDRVDAATKARSSAKTEEEKSSALTEWRDALKEMLEVLTTAAQDPALAKAVNDAKKKRYGQYDPSVNNEIGNTVWDLNAAERMKRAADIETKKRENVEKQRQLQEKIEKFGATEKGQEQMIAIKQQRDDLLHEAMLNHAPQSQIKAINDDYKKQVKQQQDDFLKQTNLLGLTPLQRQRAELRQREQETVEKAHSLGLSNVEISKIHLGFAKELGRIGAKPGFVGLDLGRTIQEQLIQSYDPTRQAAVQTATATKATAEQAKKQTDLQEKTLKAVQAFDPSARLA